MKIAIFSLLFLFPFISLAQLPRYVSFSNHFDIEKYIKQYERKFDTLGVLTQKKEYHALTISVYGIMAFDAFNKTGEEKYYNQVINQFKYFQDTSRVDISDDESEMKLPYHFNFHDLKAPWYSGMTQGTAVSFALRYYELTKDKAGLKVAQQLTKFMIKPIKEGGTLGVTPEGYQVIEEYPNSKSNPAVLNGFINGLIGLKEYLIYFPNDTIAQKVLESCYEGMFAALEHYDTPTWTSYNRKPKTISNQYIRYELTEFEHLYSIYQDERLKNQMMIWAKMATDKYDKVLTFYKFPKHQYSVLSAQKIENGDTVNVFSNYRFDKKEIKKEFTNINLSDSIQLHKKCNVRIEDSVKITNIRAVTNSILPKKIKVEGLNEKNYTLNLKDNMLSINIIDTVLKEIRVVSRNSRKKPLTLTNVHKMNCGLYEIPFFGHLEKTYIQECDTSQNYIISYSSNTKKITIFYREAADTATLRTTKWKHNNVIQNNKYSPKKPFSEFQFFVELDGMDIYFKDFNLFIEEE
ncbi:MAG: D-glucuronyl C5-epimerase family protein [Crocinitomicaceae bacterium]|jgi:heparosan-N-sulfate-glucuronate 5-epimerase